jgi:hypothetical protein
VRVDFPGGSDEARVAAQLDVWRRLAAAQDDCDRPHRGGVADMDRQDAAHVARRVEERHLPLAVHGIGCIVDVQQGARRCGRVGGAVGIHGLAGRLHGQSRAGRVLQARRGRLRAERLTGVGQSPAGRLEGAVVAQRVGIVGVLVARGDGQDTRMEDVGHAVADARRIAIVRDRFGEARGKLEMSLGAGEQQGAAVTRQPALAQGGNHLLARNGRQGEGKQTIIRRGGCGCLGRPAGFSWRDNSPFASMI